MENDGDYKKERAAYLNLVGRDDSEVLPSWSGLLRWNSADKLVWTAYYNLFLTTLFSCFEVFVLWFGVTVYLNICFGKSLPVLQRQDLARKLAVVFVLLCTWFPCRVYATWHQKGFLNEQSSLSSNPALGLIPAWLLNYLPFWIVLACAVAFAIVLALINGRKLLLRLLPLLTLGTIMTAIDRVRLLTVIWHPVMVTIQSCLNVPLVPLAVALVVFSVECLLVRDLLCYHLTKSSYLLERLWKVFGG